MLLLFPCLTFHRFFLHSVCLTLYLDSPSAPFIHKRGGACPSPSFLWKHCADFILGEHSLLSSIYVPELTCWPPASLGKRCLLPLPPPPAPLGQSDSWWQVNFNARLGLIYWKDHLSFLRTGFCENLNQATEQRDPACAWGQYRGKQPNLGEKWSLKDLTWAPGSSHAWSHSA